MVVLGSSLPSSTKKDRKNPVNVGPPLTKLSRSVHVYIYAPQCEITCLLGFANNKDADQPAHPCSLISAFVIHYLKSIISKLATSESSIFQLVSVAEETGLSLAL